MQSRKKHFNGLILLPVYLLMLVAAVNIEGPRDWGKYYVLYHSVWAFQPGI